MGLKTLWNAHVVPRMIKCACGAPGIAELRGGIVPQAKGRVFELGCGGGLNQPFYDPARVTAFAGIDPSGKLLDYAREAAALKGWQADIREGIGEQIPFSDNSFDTAVCTYTLCSVDDPAKVLSELRRILRPGGTLLFLEHGLSDEGGVARWQRRIEPLWKPLMGGCHLTRAVTAPVRAAGFQVDRSDHKYMDGMPKWAAWMEWGAAVKPA
ncbi:MAG: SAM-dependent methyltransferase [Novosphingobium sp. 28-62-57]|nr:MULTISPECIES: class I SAM-dependent methyltransferase [unclassified Novosphingobium]OYW49087.1 MAG: SAM-dependent methyltransferase [Novosphingobium sp. 12-62-10]OYZ09610.1 MAG: SAM-dependent methyltransferase [Novosphingobium sp. 28-62-57]OZA30937.1 MAG: SAM-dependent methyltransferase [Novosphingobium sp. 17-62-9]HQS71175.1 class I SAM-dependent methyltransferase [Novosphingobium sp.]